MPINMKITEPEFDLLDSIAYKYFMDNLNQCIEVNSDEDPQILAESVELLAELSFCIAQMFVQRRLDYFERKYNKTEKNND